MFNKATAGFNWKRMCQSTWRVHVRQLISFIVLPNLPFLLIRFFIPTSRPLVSLDYLGIGIIAALLPPGSVLIGVLFVAVFILDVLKTFAGIYYFSFGDAIREAGNLIHVSLWLTLPRGFLLLGTGCLIAWLAIRVSRKVEPRLMIQTLGICFVVFVSLDLASGPFPKHVSIADSNLVSEVRASYAMLHPGPTPPLASASQAILALAQGEQPPTKIVLIVEEAVGLSKNPAITDTVMSPLLGNDVSTRYYVSRGVVAFEGPTLMGEMREFCQLLGNPEDLFRVSPQVGRTCLPAKLRKAGFRTTAVHGFTEAFFGRNAWYPIVGFEHLIFREELGTSAGTCGHDFLGSCDPKLSLLIHKMLVSSPANEKDFIYWLTLNSHEPVTEETANGSKLRCEDLPAFGGKDICNMVRVQFNTNQAIETLVTASDLPPTLFVIVGDHAPPLMNLSDREQWDQEHVPWIVLKPKMLSPDHKATEPKL